MHGLRWISAGIALGTVLLFFASSKVEAFPPLPIELVLQDPSILEDVEPIDVVFTWVNKNDRAWRSARKKYLKTTQGVLKEVKKDSEGCNYDDLKYSLRSIYTFAPFIRHIFIVTSSHKPKWLANHPMVTVVSHKSIFPDKKDLPTFNSIAVESNLHRIPNLASRYLYFSNNVFLGKLVTRYDFFDKHYKIKTFLSGKKIFDAGKKVHPGISQILSRNMCMFLEDQSRNSDVKVKKEDLCYHSQAPIPMIKWIAELTEKRYPSVFKSCSSHKFRSVKDMSIVNGLIPQYALHHGAAVKANADLITVSFGRRLTKDKAKLAALLAKKPMFFCLQETGTKTKKSTDTALRRFFETYFPNPAPWEKTVKRKHR